MSEISFVNINGDPVSTSASPQKLKKKAAINRVNDANKATRHFCFEVVGVSKRDADLARAVAAGKKKDFDQQAFLNGAKPKRALKRIFCVPEAGELARSMLEKSGVWFSLRVQPIYKG